MRRPCRQIVLALVATLLVVGATASSDSDGDGVSDSKDYCPHTPATLKSNDYFDPDTGCAQSQVDVDLDGVCNPLLPALNGVKVKTSLCSGVDNCPFVYNPLQTITQASKKGDACNPGNRHFRMLATPSARTPVREVSASGAVALPGVLNAVGS